MAEGRARAILSTLADVASVVTAVALVGFLVMMIVATARMTIAPRGPQAAAAAAPAGRRPAPLPVSRVEGLETKPSLIMVRPPKARVAIIEFTDFQCPYCGVYARNVYPKVKSTFVDTGKVAYIERHFPVEAIHPFAVGASRAGECAREQGKFWDLRALLFDNQTALEEHQLVTHAAAAGLNSDALRRCMKEDRSARAVEDDRKEGQRLGVTVTPTFFVGTIEADNRIIPLKKISGAQSFDVFNAAINEALAASATASK
jgi:protein-disulfide isomerase